MYKINCENIGDVKKYIWHYRKGNKEYGPLTYEDIVELVSKGEIGPEDYVLKFGYKKFVKASEIQGLMASVPQKAEELPEKKEEPEAPMVPEAHQTHEAHETEIAAAGEEVKREIQAAFESNVSHMQHNKKAGFNQKLAIAGAALLGLGLAVWLLNMVF